MYLDDNFKNVKRCFAQNSYDRGSVMSGFFVINSQILDPHLEETPFKDLINSTLSAQSEIILVTWSSEEHYYCGSTDE